MKSIVNKLGTLSLAWLCTADAMAQASGVLPPASAIASQPVPGSPGSGVVWFVAGMALGLVVGYMLGKNANKAAAASPPST